MMILDVRWNKRHHCTILVGEKELLGSYVYVHYDVRVEVCSYIVLCEWIFNHD